MLCANRGETITPDFIFMDEKTLPPLPVLHTCSVVCVEITSYPTFFLIKGQESAFPGFRAAFPRSEGLQEF